MIHIFDLNDTLLESNSYNQYSEIMPNDLLNTLLGHIRNKYIFTNGTIGHAYSALYKMRTPIFNDIFARDNLYENQKLKPYIDPYLFIMNKIDPSGCNINIVFYDDLLDNLKTAKNLNWKTIWINSSNEERPDYVDHKFDTIIDALLFFIF